MRAPFEGVLTSPGRQERWLQAKGLWAAGGPGRVNDVSRKNPLDRPSLKANGR